MKPVEADGKLSTGLLHASFLLNFLFDPEDGGIILLRNVCCLSLEYTALYDFIERENL
jgi:hypothetical protein